MRKIFLLLVFAVFAKAQLFAQKPDSLAQQQKMQWFSDAKLGIFIHWGIYSLGKTSESWEFHNKHISHAGYMAQAAQFGAENYNPAEWVKLIQHTGSRYVVITSKHHDGVCVILGSLTTCQPNLHGRDADVEDDRCGQHRTNSKYPPEQKCHYL